MTDLPQLLNSCRTPVYAVGADGLISYANPALCSWVSLKVEAVVGRLVEYHSEPRAVDQTGPLAGLCPPPAAFGQSMTEGTISTMGQDGRLRHRRTRFLSIPLANDAPSGAVLAIAEQRDLSPLELAAALSDDPSEDQLHRDIRRFRRGRNEPDATALLLGDSPAARLMRQRFDLALKCTAGVTVTSPCPADSSALARAVHHGAHDSQTRLLPIDCRVLDTEHAAALLEKHLAPRDQRTTLLLENIDAASGDLQVRLCDMTKVSPPHRVLATSAHASFLTPPMQALAATLVIESPLVADRIADLPIMVQYYLERANAASGKRVGRATREAIDQLALYDWPHGVSQLGRAVTDAHAGCSGAEVKPEHLPSYLAHAAVSAGLPRDESDAIDLDQLLARVEREAIERALSHANDNKAEAARLLGLTRQRFYRRLENLNAPPAQESPHDHGAPDDDSPDD